MSSKNNSGSKGLNKPVLLLTFKRLEETKRSFAQIRRARPEKLYVSGDGPRSDKAGEAEKVQATRDYVMDNIDWDCEVFTLFRTENLGCRQGNSTAIDWFFENEEEGIVIEDDIVADDTFFRFASELLDYYRDDSRIMAITGINHQDNQKRGLYSYYFSQINHCWGWASWRRAWKEYRRVEKNIPLIVEQIQSGNFPGLTHDELASFMWQHNLISAYKSTVDSWAYIWSITVLVNSGLTCTPNINLVEHIGYGDDSTHIKQEPGFTKTLKCNQLDFPLTHPPYVIYNKEADNYTYRKVFFVENFKKAFEHDKAVRKAAYEKRAEQASRGRGIFQNNGGIKVLILSTRDTGEQGGAARRMHEALLRSGVDSVMLVLDKLSDTGYIAQIDQNIQGLDRSKKSAQLAYAFDVIQSRLKEYPDRKNPDIFTTTESIINYNDLAPYIQQADVINLHWVDGFFDYVNAPAAFAGKHIVWSLHDMYQLTGGCHYALKCRNYTEGCVDCPQMGVTQCKMTAESFGIKGEAYSKLSISAAVPSEWLKSCVKDSKLMSGMEVRVIPGVIDLNKYKPVDRAQAREKLGVTDDKIMILFGAENILHPAKNLQALITMLEELCGESRIKPDSIVLAVFGNGVLENVTSSYRIVELGPLVSDDVRALVYSAADLTVIPSIAESFCEVKLESMACGTPVVCFDENDMSDYIESGVNGFIAAGLDVNEMKNGIVWGVDTAASDPSVRSKCRSIIEERLAEKSVIEDMIGYLKQCAEL